MKATSIRVASTKGDFLLGSLCPLKTSKPRKKPYYFPLYWLFKRDPYNGLLYSP